MAVFHRIFGSTCIAGVFAFLSSPAVSEDLPLLWQGARAGMSEKEVLEAVPQARAEDVWQIDPKTHKNTLHHFIRFLDASDPECPAQVVFYIGTGGLAKVSIGLQKFKISNGSVCIKKIENGLVKKYGSPWHKKMDEDDISIMWHKPDGTRVRLKINSIPSADFLLLSITYDMALSDDGPQDKDIGSLL